MVFLSVVTVALATNSGRSAWYVGMRLLMMSLPFPVTLSLLPPAGAAAAAPERAASRGAALRTAVWLTNSHVPEHGCARAGRCPARCAGANSPVRTPGATG